MAGVAIQGAAYYDLYATTSNAMAEGKAGGTAARNAMMNGTAAERAKAEADIANATSQSDGGATTAAWGDRLTKGLSYLTSPLGIATSYGTDAAMSGLGFKSGGDRATDTIKNDAFVAASQETLVAALDRNTAATAASAGGHTSGPNGAGRNDSILDR